MTRGICKGCPNPCGKGVPAKQSDPIKFALCQILCEVRKEKCEGKHKGKAASGVAEQKARTDKRLSRAINKRYPGGSRAINRSRMVPYKGAVPGGRKPMSPSAIKRRLKPIRDKLLKEFGGKVARKAAKKAATAWLKLIPVVNVISTAYDVYDIAVTGYDLYKSVDKALSAYKGNVYNVRPDVEILGKDGQLKDIYDFKFDGDRWRKGQRELYNKALKDAGVKGKDVARNEISDKTCKCDGPQKLPPGVAVPSSSGAGV